MNDTRFDELQDLQTRPSLENLSYALRHPETWPKGFVWSYKGCLDCAAGLAHQLWKQIPEVRNHNIVSVMAREFAMPYEDSQRIFYDANCGQRLFGLLNIDMHEVTPDMVANLIDKYIVRQTRKTS